MCEKTSFFFSHPFKHSIPMHRDYVLNYFFESPNGLIVINRKSQFKQMNWDFYI